MSILVGFLLLASSIQATQAIALPAQPSSTPDPWSSIRFMAGEWEGESEGEPGKGTVKRTYRFVLNEKFLNEENVSTYPAQPKNPKGEVHRAAAWCSASSIRRASSTSSP